LQTVAAYFPSSSGSETHGPFNVQLLMTESSSPHIIVRDFVVSLNGKVKCLCAFDIICLLSVYSTVITQQVFIVLFIVFSFLFFCHSIKSMKFDYSFYIFDELSIM